MAGNIGAEFNLAVWRMSSQSAKLKSGKYSGHGDFADLVLYAMAAVYTQPRPYRDRGSTIRQIKIRQSSKNYDKSTKYYSRQY